MRNSRHHTLPVPPAESDQASRGGVILEKMAEALRHRGPDGEGFWISPGRQVGFAHRRLAIIDLSPAAAQPMHYAGRYTVVYNGEIYNYLELRSRLADMGYRFRTNSDTEVLLAAYDCWKQDCLGALDGMFAFAIWDEQEQVLFAARDRFGEKPFYYITGENEFLFASERKAFWAAGFKQEVDGASLLRFLALGHSQAPLDKTACFHQGVFSLPAAHMLRLHLPTKEIILSCYWDLDLTRISSLGKKEAAESFKEKFKLAVQRRLRSDVKLGASLSGGLDSSSIVATILSATTDQGAGLHTFSAVFPGFEKDESAYVELMAEAFPIESHLVYPGVDGLIDDFEMLCFHQEEPFISSSVYAQFKVYEMAAGQGTKVLLDGQGADETMAGYDRYIHWFLQELLRSRPSELWREKKALRANGASFSWGWKNYLAAYFPAQAAGLLEKRQARQIRRYQDLAPGFAAQYGDLHALYKPMVMKLNDILYHASCQQGLEELLRYADRNSMAHSRELRLPFLFHELVELIFSLPAQYKIHEGWTKWLLRKSMEQELPGAVVWRRGKIGFEPPQARWMQERRLQDYIQEAKRKLVNLGVLQPAVLREKVQPQGALAADNRDWRYLVAASTLGKATIG